MPLLSAPAERRTRFLGRWVPSELTLDAGVLKYCNEDRSRARSVPLFPNTGVSVVRAGGRAAVLEVRTQAKTLRFAMRTPGAADQWAEAVREAADPALAAAAAQRRADADAAAAAKPKPNGSKPAAAQEQRQEQEQEQEPQPGPQAAAAAAFFAELAAEDGEEDEILDGGITRLCELLELDPQAAEVLLLSWRMGAAEMCVFRREEFLRGMADLRCGSAAELRAALPRLRAATAADAAAFRDFYQFAFRFSCEPGQRSVPAEVAAAMWPIVLGAAAPGALPLAGEFLAYAESAAFAANEKSVSKDPWNMVLQFLEAVRSPDELRRVAEEDDGSWPLLVDGFVEYASSGSS